MSANFWGTEWSDALSMSNAEIDAEHKEFIELVNHLNGEITHVQRDKEEILRTIERISEQATGHFEHEERLLIDNAYPESQEHAEIHAGLLGKIKQALQTIQKTEHIPDWVEAGHEVERLLLEHLKAEDSKYINYLRTD